MSNRFANGANAFGFCDVCGFRFPLKRLKNVVIKTKQTAIRACPQCWTPDQPQLQLGMYPVADPQAIRDPRPEPLGISRLVNWAWYPVASAGVDFSIGSVTTEIESYPLPPTAKWTAPIYGGTLSDSDRLWTLTSSAGSQFTAVASDTNIVGKIYCEFEMVSKTSNLIYQSFGISKFLGGSGFPYGNFNSSANYSIFSRLPDVFGGCGLPLSGVATAASYSNNAAYGFTPGTRIGVAVDQTNGRIWYRIAGNWVQGDPSTDTNPTQTFTPGADTWAFVSSMYSCNVSVSYAFAVRIYAAAYEFTGSIPTGFSAYG
jgi:hypothetical protein